MSGHKSNSAPRTRWRFDAASLLVALAGATIVGASGCDSPTSPTTDVAAPRSIDATRDFSGTVEIPGNVTMNLSLAIRGPSARREMASALPTFFATLVAQSGAAVTGTYTLNTLGTRAGRVDGSFTGASFLTAGQFSGTLTEVLNGCVAQRQYAGPISIAGVNWTAGPHVQQCPAGTFDALQQIAIAAIDAVVIGTPDPVVDPVPVDTFRLTVGKTGDGRGTVTSDPAGIDCGPSCSWLFADATLVTLTATPSQGSEFSGWGGDADCVDGEVTMTMERRCIAEFDDPSLP